ncbi:hypothetical protein AB0933_32765 [Streptomyces venezuelae]|uniref:DUF7352 domain-containing protein n=1 Tax=Streptomyces venezuelae TaxID=54571 RepID=UPI003457065F
MSTPEPTQPAVIHRAALALDERPHGIDLTGDILHVAVGRSRVVDLWYQPRPDGVQAMRRSFQVVATNQPIPAHLGTVIGHQGTALAPESGQEWHVLENQCPHPPEVIETDPESDTTSCGQCGVRLQDDGQGGWIPA